MGHVHVQVLVMIHVQLYIFTCVGYVQGMSDLLSPILAVMENEHDSFWCFVGLMNMIKDRFEVTQENMRLRIRQLRALLDVSDPHFYQYLRKYMYIYTCNTCSLVHAFLSVVHRVSLPNFHNGPLRPKNDTRTHT